MFTKSNQYKKKRVCRPKMLQCSLGVQAVYARVAAALTQLSPLPGRGIITRRQLYGVSSDLPASQLSMKHTRDLIEAALHMMQERMS